MKKPELVQTVQNLAKITRDHEKYLCKAVPKTLATVFTMDRLERIVCTVARRNPLLLNCTRDSVMYCVVQACSLGLEPGGTMDHIYLIPRKNNKLQVYECSIIIGYKGLIELARRSGKFKGVEAHVVHANDKIEVKWGTETKVVHEPCLVGDRGDIIGAHCRADFTNGGMHHEYMTIEDINHVRKSSQSANVWDKHFGEMARKSVIRRASKYWPQAVDMMDAVMVDGTTHDEMTDPMVYDVVAEEEPSDNLDAAKAGVDAHIESLDQDG